MIITFEGRKIEIELSGFGDHGDDIQVESAYYVDNGEPVNDDDLDDIMNANADIIYTHQYEALASQAFDDWKNYEER